MNDTIESFKSDIRTGIMDEPKEMKGMNKRPKTEVEAGYRNEG